MKHIRVIDDAIQNKTRSTYRGNSDYYEWVVAKPLEATGFLKWKIRFQKALAVIFGKADTFRYSKYQ